MASTPTLGERARERSGAAQAPRNHRLVRDPRCSDALDLLERKRRADGMFPVEWTNVRTVDRIETRGTYAGWSPLAKRRGNPLVTVDALWVLREAGRHQPKPT